MTDTPQAPHGESCEKNPHIAARKQAERQRDELLDVILAQAKRSIASIPHDIWATAVRISKEINPDPVNPVHPVKKTESQP